MLFLDLEDLRAVPLKSVERLAEALDARLNRFPEEPDDSYQDRLARQIMWVEEMLAEDESRLQNRPDGCSRSMDRKKLLSLCWKHTHNDFKGKSKDGTKSVLKLVPGVGTCSVALTSLTDEELLEKIPTKFRPVNP